MKVAKKILGWMFLIVGVLGTAANVSYIIAGVQGRIVFLLFGIVLVVLGLWLATGTGTRASKQKEKAVETKAPEPVKAIVGTKRLAIFTAVVLLLMIAGFVLVRRLGPSSNRRKQPTVVTVVVPNLGASASMTDSSIATPLVSALNDLPAVIRVETISNTEKCTAVVSFGPDVELPAAIQVVRQRLAALSGKLPAEIGVSEIQTAGAASLPRFWVALASGTSSHVDFKAGDFTELARRLIRDELSRLPNVTDVQLIGDHEPVLILDAAGMASRGLSITDVQRALAEGSQSKGDTLHRPSSPEQSAWKSITITVRNEVPVRLGDIASLEMPKLKVMSFEDVLQMGQDDSVKTDWGQAVLLAISSGQNTPTTLGVEQELARLEATLPRGIKLRLLADLSSKRAVLIEVEHSPDQPEPATLQRNVENALRAVKPWSVFLSFSSGNVDDPFKILVIPGNNLIGGAAFHKKVDSIPGVVRSRVRELSNGRVSVQIALVGPDPALLTQWVNALMARITSDNLVLDAELFPRTESPNPSLQLVVDQDAAKSLGVSTATVTDALKLAYGKWTITLDGQLVKTKVIGDSDPGLMQRLYVKSTTSGDLVPMASLLHLERGVVEPLVIYRIGRSPAIRITGCPTSDVSPEVTMAKCIGAANVEREKLMLSNEYRAIDLVGSMD